MSIQPHQPAPSSQVSIPFLRNQSLLLDNHNAFGTHLSIKDYPASHREVKGISFIPKSNNNEPFSPLKGSQTTHARNQTLQIFNHNTQLDRNFSPKDQLERHSPTERIERGDSLTRVQYLVERARKDYGKNHAKKSQKNKGVMYINELWDHKYEEKTIRAAGIDKEVFEIEKLSIRTGQPKANNNGVQAIEQRFSSKNSLPLTARVSPIGETPKSKVSAGALTQRGRSKKTLEMMPTKEGLNEDNESMLLQSRNSSLPQIAPKTQKRPSRVIIPRSISQKDFNVPSLAATATNHGFGALNESLELEKEGTFGMMNESNPTRRTSILKASGSGAPKSTRVVRIDSNVRIMKQDSLVRSEQASMVWSSPRSHRDIHSPTHSERAKMFLQDKTQNLNELIDRCNLELDEKSEWLSVINNMHGLLLLPKYNKKLRFELSKKEKMIENCRSALKVREKSLKKFWT